MNNRNYAVTLDEEDWGLVMTILDVAKEDVSSLMESEINRIICVIKECINLDNKKAD